MYKQLFRATDTKIKILDTFEIFVPSENGTVEVLWPNGMLSTENLLDGWKFQIHRHGLYLDIPIYYPGLKVKI